MNQISALDNPLGVDMLLDKLKIILGLHLLLNIHSGLSLPVYRSPVAQFFLSKP